MEKENVKYSQLESLYTFLEEEEYDSEAIMADFDKYNIIQNSNILQAIQCQQCACSIAKFVKSCQCLVTVSVFPNDDK